MGKGEVQKGVQSGEYSAAYFLLIGFRFFPFSVDAFSVGVLVSEPVDAGDSDSRSAFVRATGMVGPWEVTCQNGFEEVVVLVPEYTEWNVGVALEIVERRGRGSGGKVVCKAGVSTRIYRGEDDEQRRF